jgi:NAD-dependent DNA ligase
MIEDLEKKREVYDYQLLGSIGIVGMGRKIFKKVLEDYTIDQLLEIVDMRQFNKLTDIRGIADKSARKIIYGIEENKDIIRKLRKELIVTRPGKKEWKGSVCFTGFRDKDLEERFEELGFEPVNSVNKNLSVLVVNSLNDTSSKIDKARKYGVNIIARNDVDKLIEYLNVNKEE